jgi:hypothetical protein
MFTRRQWLGSAYAVAAEGTLPFESAEGETKLSRETERRIAALDERRRWFDACPKTLVDGASSSARIRVTGSSAE